MKYLSAVRVISAVVIIGVVGVGLRHMNPTNNDASLTTTSAAFAEASVAPLDALSPTPTPDPSITPVLATDVASDVPVDVTVTPTSTPEASPVPAATPQPAVQNYTVNTTDAYGNINGTASVTVSPN